jgi:molybdopterin converting factor small subunit
VTANTANQASADQGKTPPAFVVRICFYSYFKELTGCQETSETLPEGSTLADLWDKIVARFPQLSTMRKSTLFAIGVDYQPLGTVLKAGDEVSLFPPVQGG